LTARIFAQVVGVVLLLLGIGGLLLGDGLLVGLLNIDIGEDIVHILTGGILAYVGFGQRDQNVARSVVGVLGVVYLLVGLLGFVLPFMFGLVPSGYTIGDNLVHLALGALGIVVGFLSGGGSPLHGEQDVIGRSFSYGFPRRTPLGSTGNHRDLAERYSVA
jgi:hypothetical protein